MTSSYLLDPDWPPARIDALINHLGAKTQTALADRLGIFREGSGDGGRSRAVPEIATPLVTPPTSDRVRE